MTPDLIMAMRHGAADSYIVQEYLSHGDPLHPDLCGRTFTLYLGNGYVDPARNTAEGLRDVAICAQFLGNRCYRRFGGGQMEQVLDDMVCISFIQTPGEVLATIRALREMGIAGNINLLVEYVQGYPVEIKAY